MLGFLFRLPTQCLWCACAALTAAVIRAAAGIVLEGLEEWEIQPEEIVLGPRIGIGRCARSAIVGAAASQRPYPPCPCLRSQALELSLAFFGTWGMLPYCAKPCPSPMP